MGIVLHRRWINFSVLAGAFLLLGFTITSCHRSALQEGGGNTQSVISTVATLQEDLPESNDLCMICHLDFAYDPIAEDHLAADLTCAHCHGVSVDHMHDETMMTSPDIMFGRREVNALCSGCHTSHSNQDAVNAFRIEWQGKHRENGRSIMPNSICTDCHGLHTIPRR
jgi:hypothetical protein